MGRFEDDLRDIHQRIMSAPCPECGEPGEFMEGMPVPVAFLQFMFKAFLQFMFKDEALNLPTDASALHPLALACRHRCHNADCNCEGWGQFAFAKLAVKEEKVGKHTIEDILSSITPN